MKITDKFLSTTDTAELLNVCTKTIRNLAASGQLRSFRIGRSLRFKLADIETFLRWSGQAL